MERPQWRPQSEIVTAADLDRLCARHRVVVLHCGADWNAHDITMDFAVQEFQSEFADQIGFYALEFDDERNWDFLRQYDIVSIPSLVCMAEGQWYQTLVGLRPKPELRATLQRWVTELTTPPSR